MERYFVPSSLTFKSVVAITSICLSGLFVYDNAPRLRRQRTSTGQAPLALQRHVADCLSCISRHLTLHDCTARYFSRTDCMNNELIRQTVSRIQKLTKVMATCVCDVIMTCIIIYHTAQNHVHTSISALYDNVCIDFKT